MKRKTKPQQIDRYQIRFDEEAFIDLFSGGGGTSTGIEKAIARPVFAAVNLAPRELYNAMGFPADYIIDRDYLGKPYPKSKQVARCGNAVCPPMAEAMVRANFPEYCTVVINTMAQFHNMVSV